MYLQLVARIGFAWVQWKSKFGLREYAQAGAQANKQEALQLGVRGETYAYWYLRRLGYLFLARNYSPSRMKGELDLVGFDGETLVIVEVRTRRATPGQAAQPELSITVEKHEVLVRTAHYFLRERRIQDCPIRFDVVAIENTPGKPPVVRLHKAALSPQLPPRAH
ncbi:MAG TPA: YraN family protein [Candidatus Acidoferrum sp.]|nr:YraN family protein [Candidatus Acidoferrum sp.]